MANGIRWGLVGAWVCLLGTLAFVGGCALFGDEAPAAEVDEVAESHTDSDISRARIRRYIDVGRLTKGRGAPSSELRSLGYV